jgi:hypothetical protein
LTFPGLFHRANYFSACTCALGCAALAAQLCERGQGSRGSVRFRHYPVTDNALALQVAESCKDRLFPLVFRAYLGYLSYSDAPPVNSIGFTHLAVDAVGIHFAQTVENSRPGLAAYLHRGSLFRGGA